MTDEYWFERDMGDGTILVLAPITDSAFVAHDVAQMGLGGNHGYFIQRFDKDGVRDVVGKIDAEHAFEVADLLGMR